MYLIISDHFQEIPESVCPDCVSCGTTPPVGLRGIICRDPYNPSSMEIYCKNVVKKKDLIVKQEKILVGI